MFFLARFSKKFGKKIEGISQATVDRLSSYSWPGNIRELQNVIERAVIVSQGAVLELGPDLVSVLASANISGADDRSDRVTKPSASPLPAAATLEEIQRVHIVAVLNQTQGVVEGPRGAAKILGLHPNTLRHRMQKLGLKRSYQES